jgi:hypothetical protein
LFSPIVQRRSAAPANFVLTFPMLPMIAIEPFPGVMQMNVKFFQQQQKALSLH